MKVECDDVEMLADVFYHKALPAGMLEALTAHVQACKNKCYQHIWDYERDLRRRLDVFRADQHPLDRHLLKASPQKSDQR